MNLNEITKNTRVTNKNGHITFEDARATRINEVLKINTAPTSFEDLFGDLSDSIFIHGLNLSQLNLNSLKGCPREIRGAFAIENNLHLKNLSYFPGKIAPKYSTDLLSIDFELISELRKLNINIYKDLIIFVKGKNLQLPKNRIFKEIVHSFYEYRKLNGSFIDISGDFIDPESIFDLTELEKYYSLYKKVGANKEKFDRALSLL